MPILLAIDPGYDRVGWAVGNARSAFKLDLLAYGCIQTNSKKSLIERYQAIDTELTEIIKTHQPTIMAIESLFFTNNQKTALHVSEARGVIISCAFRHQLSVDEYTPLQIKQGVTGYGRADKAAVEKMVRLQLKLPTQTKIIDDTLDALGLLITHAASASLSKRV